jgi:hypothetical protein
MSVGGTVLAPLTRHRMTYRELLDDRFDFGLRNYDADSYPVQVALPRIVEGLADGTEFGEYSNLHLITNMLTMAHLGYAVPFDSQRILDLGVDLSLSFIRGEWVKAHPNRAVEIDKRPDNLKMEWFDTWRMGFLLALLSDRAADLRELADWPEPWMETDRPLLIGYRVHPLYANLYLVIANEFRTTPLPNLEELRTLLRQARRKDPKVLHWAWEAVLARDQAAFQQGIIAAVREWDRTFNGYVAHPRYCLAQDACTVLAAGRRLGMEPPELEPKIAARLLTRESIRLGTSHTGGYAPSPPKDPTRKLLQDFGIGRRED